MRCRSRQARVDDRPSNTEVPERTNKCITRMKQHSGTRSHDCHDSLTRLVISQNAGELRRVTNLVMMGRA